MAAYFVSVTFKPLLSSSETVGNVSEELQERMKLPMFHRELPLRLCQLQENAPFLQRSQMSEGERQQLCPISGYRVQEENGGVLPWCL
jgi:hypothetical protein